MKDLMESGVMPPFYSAIDKQADALLKIEDVYVREMVALRFVTRLILSMYNDVTKVWPFFMKCFPDDGSDLYANI